jgi:hypothetical protein
MEPGSLHGDWRIRINGGEQFGPGEFVETASHVRGSLGYDITKRLARGRNELLVELKTDRLDGGLVNALYLAGDFAVRFSPLRLAARSEKGWFDAWEANGLPYYSGAVEYEMNVDISAVPEHESIMADFEFVEQFQDACEVSLNGGAWHAMPWRPYTAMLKAGELRAGVNLVRLRVYTTLIRAFEGQWFDVAGHCYRQIDTK